MPQGPPQPPAPPAPRRRRLGGALTAIVLGLGAVVGAAAMLLAQNSDLAEVSGRIGWAAATGTIGLGAIIAGIAGRRAILTSLIALCLAFGTLMASVVPEDASLTGPSGDETWRPTTVTSATAYDLTAGSGKLDLTGVTAPATPTTIRANVSLGELVITVPDDMTVQIRGRVDFGQLTADDPAGRAGEPMGTGGTNSRRTFTYGEGTPALTVDARVGVGEIRIERTTTS